MFQFSSGIGEMPASAPSALLSLWIKDLIWLVVLRAPAALHPCPLQILLFPDFVSFPRARLAFGNVSSNCASASASLCCWDPLEPQKTVGTLALLCQDNPWAVYMGCILSLCLLWVRWQYKKPFIFPKSEGLTPLVLAKTLVRFLL